MHVATSRAVLTFSALSLSAVLLACPPGWIDLIANTSSIPISFRISWGSAATGADSSFEPTCLKPFFWLVPVSRIEEHRIPRRLDDLEPASVTYDDTNCSATVTIPPGMAAAAGDPRGSSGPLLSFADSIAILHGRNETEFSAETYMFKTEPGYGSPRINVWRVNSEEFRTAT
jgi:hypothetical protein